MDKASIVKISDHKHELRFEYTLENKSGSNIQFPSIHPSMDRLVEVSLTDKDQQAIHLVKNSLAGLTLPQPAARKILAGKTTRSYSVPIIPNTLKPNDPVNVRIRLHVPSHFDELRSSLEAPTLTLAWPEEPKKKKR